MTPWDGEVYLKCLQHQKVVTAVTLKKHAHTVSNLEYATLKLSNFSVKLHDFDPIIALFDTGAT